METVSWWMVVRRSAVVGVAVGVIAFVYWMGLPDVAGALALSGLAMLVVWYVRSGALAPMCLQRRSFIGVRNSARWEFSKAMICAGVGLDVVRLVFFAERRFFVLNYGVVTRAAVWVLVALWLLGVSVFLVRAFAAYLLSLRTSG